MDDYSILLDQDRGEEMMAELMAEETAKDLIKNLTKNNHCYLCLRPCRGKYQAFWPGKKKKQLVAMDVCFKCGQSFGEKKTNG